MTIENTIYAMLTESTGVHMMDSGGANGRHWQRNQRKTIDDFRNAPSATVEVSIHNYKDKESAEFLRVVDVFHLLTNVLRLDDLCKEYNVLECGNWNGDYYGTDLEQCEFLHCSGLVPKGQGFNSSNWENNLSQTLQGQLFEHDITGETYVLIQIHNGADIRGGYTDAKLFKFRDHYEEYALFDADVLFDDMHFAGGDIDHRELGLLVDDDLLEIAKKIGVGVHPADACYFS